MADRKAYVSFYKGMLALWIDHYPSATAEQKDPDGWVSDVGQATNYVIARLCELSKCSDARVVMLNEYAAEWWAKIDRARRAKAAKERREQAASAQSLFAIPEHVERDGRNAGFERTRGKREFREHRAREAREKRAKGYV